MFDKLGMIENFGTGISRTIESYKNYDVKPEFKATENFFFVTLPNINYASSGSINDSINDIGLEILLGTGENRQKVSSENRHFQSIKNNQS